MISKANRELSIDVRRLLESGKLNDSDFGNLAALYSQLDAASEGEDRLQQFEERSTWKRIFAEAGT